MYTQEEADSDPSSSDEDSEYEIPSTANNGMSGDHNQHHPHHYQRDIYPTGPIPEGTTPIGRNPFEKSNQIKIVINVCFSFNPLKHKGPLKMNIKQEIIRALEDAHLITYDFASNDFVKLNPLDLNYFLCSTKIKGCFIQELPYSIGIFVEIKVPNRIYKFLEDIHSNKIKESDREKVKANNVYDFILCGNTHSAQPIKCSGWKYKPRPGLEKVFAKLGTVMSGATNMWGDKSQYFQALNKWLVEASSKGVQSLLSSGMGANIMASEAGKDFVWVTNEDKERVDKTVSSTIKSMGVLETFNLRGADPINVVIKRSDLLHASPDGKLRLDHWTDLSKTSDLAKLSAEDQQTILDKYYNIDFTLELCVGAPVNTAHGSM